MEILLFGKCVALGLAVAAPLGPIGALCINRTLERGFWAGIAGGLGTALADALYAGLAAMGFAAFSAGLGRVEAPLKLAGGAFMLWLGCKSLAPTRVRQAARVGARDLCGTIAATFFLTLANPMTLLVFAALFAGVGLAEVPGPANAAIVVAGVFTGSMLWWFALGGGVTLARRRLAEGFGRWISRLSGGVLILFGLYSLGSWIRGIVER